MNIYLTRYNKLISHYQNIIVEGYKERHHIKPVCMGGDDSFSNLVYLSAKAHFIAHWLLHKAYPKNKKLAHAFGMMVCTNDLQERIWSSRQYKEAREALSFAMKGRKRPDLAARNRANKGKKLNLTEEQREARRALGRKNKGRKRPDLSYYNKYVRKPNRDAFKEYNERKKREGFTPEEIEKKRMAGKAKKKKRCFV